MAAIFHHAFDRPIEVRLGGADAASWQAVQIRIGSGGSVSLSREEAAQLAVDLLNAVDATPVDAEVAA